MRPERNHIRKTESDRQANVLTIIVLTFVVVTLGIYFIFNSSYSRGPNMEYKETFTQIKGIGIAVIYLYALYALRFDIEATKKFAVFMGVSCIVFILLPLVPGLGLERNGARRWIQLGITIQPSEIVKLLLIMTLAAILEPLKRTHPVKGKVYAPNGLYALLLIGAVFAALVKFQDDLGTAVVIGVIGLVICIIASVDVKQIWWSCGIAGLLFAIALMEPYRQVRMHVWWDPLKHLKDEGMQTAETLMGIGNAGWLGVGVGQGRIKWNIPAANTDFAYATIIEELGLFGAMAFAILIFGLAFACVFGAAKYAKSRYSMLVGTGIGLWLMIQTGFNMMVILNVLPPTGFPLPFASSGGTAIAINIIAIGIAVFVVMGDGLYKPKATSTKTNGNVRRKGLIS